MRMALGTVVMAGVLALAICVPATGQADDIERAVELPELEVYRVFLGVDCSKPHMIDLPCNVLYECDPPGATSRCEDAPGERRGD